MTDSGGEVKKKMSNGLKTVSFNENEQILLDGEPIENVKKYKLKNSAKPSEPAELTVTMEVIVGGVVSALKK